MKNVLVTGASGGMGYATAELFHSKGYKVFALDLRPRDFSDGITYIPIDITDEESVKQAFSKVAEQVDTLFAIVHFAGVYMLDSLLEMDAKSFERIFEINVFGAFLINKHFRALLKSGSKILITTSELAPLDPLPFTGIYAVTKAALDKYAYSLRMEMQLLNIEVSVLRAGAVKTDMLGKSTSDLDAFCEKTKLYSCNAKRFKEIVESVEAKCIPTEKIAKKVLKILSKKRCRFAYAINRNKLLLLLNALPKRIQLFAIRKVLKK